MRSDREEIDAILERQDAARKRAMKAWTAQAALAAEWSARRPRDGGETASEGSDPQDQVPVAPLGLLGELALHSLGWRDRDPRSDEPPGSAEKGGDGDPPPDGGDGTVCGSITDPTTDDTAGAADAASSTHTGKHGGVAQCAGSRKGDEYEIVPPESIIEIVVTPGDGHGGGGGDGGGGVIMTPGGDPTPSDPVPPTGLPPIQNPPIPTPTDTPPRTLDTSLDPDVREKPQVNTPLGPLGLHGGTVTDHLSEQFLQLWKDGSAMDWKPTDYYYHDMSTCQNAPLAEVTCPNGATYYACVVRGSNPPETYYFTLDEHCSLKQLNGPPC